jgi:hypothetical protein
MEIATEDREGNEGVTADTLAEEVCGAQKPAAGAKGWALRLNPSGKTETPSAHSKAGTAR